MPVNGLGVTENRATDGRALAVVLGPAQLAERVDERALDGGVELLPGQGGRLRGLVEHVPGRGHGLGDRVLAEHEVLKEELARGLVGIKAGVARGARVVLDGLVEAGRAGDLEGGAAQQLLVAVELGPGERADQDHDVGVVLGLPSAVVVTFATLWTGESAPVAVDVPLVRWTVRTAPSGRLLRLQVKDMGVDAAGAGGGPAVDRPRGAGIGGQVSVSTDTLPTDAGTSWSVDGGTAAGTCGIAAGVLTCNLGDLPDGAVRTVHLTSGTSAATGADSPVHNVAKVTTTADGEAQDDADVVVLVGSLAWSKFDGHQQLLGGATFQVTGPSGFGETVEDNTGALDYSGLDADEAAGEFLLEDLLLGEYTVTETVAPAGYMLDETPQSATLTREQLDASIESPFVNTLGELSWTKDNGKGTPIGGATFSVTPNPFTGTGSLSVKDNDANDQDKTARAFHLVDVRVGSYTVTETAAPEGYVLDKGSCSITVGEVSVDARLSSEVPACAFHNTPIPPAIAIIKTAGGSAGSQAADDTVYKAKSFAGNVTYKYVVSNTGEVRLTGVWVVDDNGTPANTEDDWLPACYAGDLLLVQPFPLAAGASVTCYATMDITEDTTNVATASGKSVGEGTDVSANGRCRGQIVGPAVTIVKTAGGSAASQVADGETYATEDGTDNVVYKYVVTNTGDTPLTITSLSDDKLGSISVEDCDTWSLPDKGDKATCTVSASISKDTENTASVKATSPAGAEVQATDKANVILRHVAIEKTNDATSPLLVGNDVRYTLTFDVQNGPIASMTVTDTLPARSSTRATSASPRRPSWARSSPGTCRTWPTAPPSPTPPPSPTAPPPGATRTSPRSPTAPASPATATTTRRSRWSPPRSSWSRPPAMLPTG